MKNVGRGDNGGLGEQLPEVLRKYREQQGQVGGFVHVLQRGDVFDDKTVV